MRPEGKVVINLLNQVGRMFPQAVYFPIRTLYLTLKVTTISGNIFLGLVFRIPMYYGDQQDVDHIRSRIACTLLWSV